MTTWYWHKKDMFTDGKEQTTQKYTNLTMDL